MFRSAPTPTVRIRLQGSVLITTVILITPTSLLLLILVTLMLSLLWQAKMSTVKRISCKRLMRMRTFSSSDKCCTHRLTDEPLSITNLDLAVEPHRGHFLQPLEAERVELEHGSAVFGVLKNSHSVVRWAAVGKLHELFE